MDTSAKLQTQLETVLYGTAWYGSPIYTIIECVSFDAAYEKPAGATHNIAAIVMHMLAWTEEVSNRMQGKPAAEPMRGDWPDTGKPDEQKWQQLIAFFKLANVELTQLISNFPAGSWAELINGDRGDGLTYEGMIIGLIEHHVYHAGQISLLNKMING
jgi:uncharacterized damage-inducible protein DinB